MASHKTGYLRVGGGPSRSLIPTSAGPDEGDLGALTQFPPASLSETYTLHFIDGMKLLKKSLGFPTAFPITQNRNPICTFNVTNCPSVTSLLPGVRLPNAPENSSLVIIKYGGNPEGRK